MGNRVRKRKGRPVNGLLLLDKSQGMTSNAALQECKRLMYAAKAGHTGSLDPLATGVLPLCFGEATKFSQYLLNADKTYFATITLGASSSTGDADGELKYRMDPSGIEDTAIEQVIEALQGVQQQVPPMYSALKHEGQRLYDLARAGKEVVREAREITVFSARCVQIRRDVATKVVGNKDDGNGDGNNRDPKGFDRSVEVDCELRVSKGTYIRSIAEQVGEQLGVGGYLSALRRTAVGDFAIQQCTTLGELRLLKETGKFSEMDALLLPVEQALEHLPSVELDENTGYYLSKGNPVQVPSAPIEGEVRLSWEDGRFIGIGVIDSDGLVAPRRLVVQ